jgi:hypothetical protein
VTRNIIGIHINMSSIITNDSIGINIHNIKKKIHETIQTQKINKEQKKKKNNKVILVKK